MLLIIWLQIHFQMKKNIELLVDKNQKEILNVYSPWVA